MTQKIMIALLFVLLNVFGTIACQTMTGTTGKRQTAPTISEIFEGRMHN